MVAFLIIGTIASLDSEAKAVSYHIPRNSAQIPYTYTAIGIVNMQVISVKAWGRFSENKKFRARDEQTAAVIQVRLESQRYRQGSCRTRDRSRSLVCSR